MAWKSKKSHVFKILQVPGTLNKQFKTDVWLNNYFQCKDLVHHPIETSIIKWYILFQVHLYRQHINNFKFMLQTIGTLDLNSTSGKVLGSSFSDFRKPNRIHACITVRFFLILFQLFQLCLLIYVLGCPPAQDSLSQWLNFKLCGITCLVGKIKFKLLSQGPFAE